MNKWHFLPSLLASLASIITVSNLEAAEATKFDPKDHAIIKANRPDGNHVSSYAIAHNLVNQTTPACQFDPSMNAEQFTQWQAKVRSAMKKLMKFPVHQSISQPTLVKSVQRNGYKIERWDAYPFKGAVAPYFVMIPDQIAKDQQSPVIMCIPGSGQTKELLAGETSPDLSAPANEVSANAMAYHFVKQGWIAVVVDNAGTGEQADLEQKAGRHGYNYDSIARYLLEIDWSWLGYTSYVDQVILNWVKEQPWCNPKRIVLSGFSLGTEPMMVLGVLNPDIYAFVYNDFLCRTKERASVMTMPAGNGARPFPNSIRHLIPGFWQQFDFPDIVASLAPRPVICTEGGLDRDFQLIQKAFDIAGSPNHFKFIHQPKFANAERWQKDELPKGINKTEFFHHANVDPSNHFFKRDDIMPWLSQFLNQGSNNKSESK